MILIEGFSIRIIIRTMPSILSFNAQSNYRISFEYYAPVAGVYRAVVRSSPKGEVLLNIPLDGRGFFSESFSTANSDDCYFAIEKKGKGILILDDFGVHP